MQIIVLGMHRAGTSAITRLINLMGAYLGPEDQMLPATADNPKGYWERIDVLQLHERLLEALDADWYITSAVDPASIPGDALEQFEERARTILREMDEHRPWVMKDPRLCLLLPLWRPLLETPICVHVARHPLATAQSLEKRDRFPLHFGAALWEEYNARALLVSSGLPRFAVCYETLMEQPLATAQALHQSLRACGIQGLRLPDEQAIRDFLASELQHHRARAETDSVWLTPHQCALWEALQASNLDVDQALLADPVRAALLGGYEPLIKNQCEQHWLDTQLAEVQQQLANTESALRQKDALLKKSVSDLKSLQRLFETLHHDTELAFASWTWRAGFAIAETGRKAGLLHRTPTVQDHIAQVVRNYRAWRRRQTQALDPNGGLAEEHFDEAAYLAQYPDVRDAIERGEFASGREHFELQGQQEIASGVRPYQSRFLAAGDSASEEILDPEQCRKDIERWSRKPSISIIMPVYNVEPHWLEAAIRSVARQIYPYWELCIADDGSTRPETLDVLRRLDDPRYKIQFLERNRGIAGASNAALASAEGEYIAFLDHDDELTPDALYHVVKAIHQHEPDLIYSDEDKLSPQGYYLEPHFKPDYSPDLILSINYICHLSVYRKSLLDRTGPFRDGFEGAQDHDLLLRALDGAERIHHIPKILYHWRMIPGSTAARFDSKHYAWEAGRRAVEDALRRRGIAGEALLGQYPGSYRVKRTIQQRPLISILMPFRDHADLLRNCLDSILEQSTYANFELIGISNNSLEPETFAAMDHYAAKDPRIRFIRHDAPFNYAAINNFAARQAKGEHLLLLNNDMTVITPDWLEALLEQSQRPEIGAVGAKLYYPDDTVQHGGVIVGIGGIAGHAHKYAPRDEPGYFSRSHLIQNLSAVTAACLMVKKALYDKVGGMDERHLTVAFNDVDFCLRLREKGYLNIFTPYCELYHHESKTRGYEDTPRKKQRFAKEIAYMRKRHAAILRDGDPYYNVNLPLDREDFGML